MKLFTNQNAGKQINVNKIIVGLCECTVVSAIKRSYTNKASY